ncbi:reverse transcriptase domain-containing protein [Tanacetum coccineum]
MPFGLKNARATYQRLVDTIFEGQMGRNLEVYVDDMVIKSKTDPKMIKDVKETLLTLKKVNMKLNPKKCSFGMEEGKFLGYIVTSKGIRANPEKVKAVVNMPSLSNLKQMQRLSGKLAALNRFLSKAAERALPCLDTLKKCTNKKDFHWTTEAEEAFQAMKKLIVELPTLTAPKKEEELMVYLSAANEAVSAVLLVEREGRHMEVVYRWSIQRTRIRSRSHPDRSRRSKKMHVFVDSKLVISHIPSEENRKADALSKLAAVQCEGLTKGVLIEELNERSVDTAEVNAIIEEATRTWMTPIQEYIKKKILPEDATEARTIREKARNYTIEEGVLYRKSYLGPLLRCIGPQQAKYLIKEIHMGSCGMHDGLRRAVHKAMNVGYFWPSMHRDANNEISRCDSCQVFGIPATIITDNRTQLINDSFKSWAEGLGIQLVSTSVYHPQANGAVERANRSIMQGIKTRLHQEGGAWVEELPNVLWAHRTTPKTTNGVTPFSLAYGTEAVIPAEIGIPTRRTIQGSDEENEEALRLNLNLLE